MAIILFFYRLSLITFPQSLHKKWSFPLRISSVNVTKFAVSLDLVTSTEKILNGKLHFLCSEFISKSLFRLERFRLLHDRWLVLTFYIAFISLFTTPFISLNFLTVLIQSDSQNLNVLNKTFTKFQANRAI